ncbi:MAG TPA: RodZ domain-containing protein [Gaiellaceae bacterium]|jgi:transcriptional regulator with XRE-family HTH domain
MIEIGSSLREARRHRNIELAEVERATHIRVKQLEALEQERFELLPPDPYRRSFLREYADFLGLDADLYTTEYDLRFHPPEPRLPGPPPRRARRPRGKRPLLAFGVIVVAALVALAAWQLGGSGGKGTVASRTPPTTTRQTPSTRPQTSTGTTTPKSTPQLLVLTATRGSCWLLVRVGSAAGPIVYQQTLQAGHTLRLGLHRPLWIRLGAPWSLDAAIGGQSLTLPTHLGNVVASAGGLRSTP